MKKYKIAIVRPDGNVIPKGYYNSQELGLAKHLAILNVDVDVYYAGNVEKVTPSQVDCSGTGQVNLIELPFYMVPLIQQAMFPDLIKELKKVKYDLIQVNEYNDIICSQVVNYANKNNIASVVYQGMHKNMSGRVNNLYTSLHNKIILPNFIKRVSKALTKTKVATDFLKCKGFNNVSVMPVGLDTNAFSPSICNLSKIEFNELYKIPTTHKVVLYIGNFEQRRNINFLLDIAKHSEKQEISFIFIGEGEMFKEAKQRVNDENLTNVRLPGRLPQKQLASIYQSSDLFLLASDYEIYGMVVLEAMFYGVPVISNNSAGPSSIIDSGGNGIIFNELDVEEWSSMIERLCTDPIQLNRLKNNAKNKIERHLTWGVIAQKYLDEVIKIHCH